MVHIKREGVVLKGTSREFENEGVMNPAVIVEGTSVHMFYRAVRQGNHSTIGYCRLEGPLKVAERNSEPLIVPEFDYESQGVEDPRIVKIEDTYYLSYTAYDGFNAVGALATSSDLKTFEKKSVITSMITYPQFRELLRTRQADIISKYYRSGNKRESTNENGKPLFLMDKNVVFFPRKINGKFYFLHRIRPDIQFVAVEQLEMLTKDYWKTYYQHFDRRILLAPYHDHEASYIGAGCPPIETGVGWLLIYHSVYDTPSGYVYSACAALLDIDNPRVEIARLPRPLFTPEADYELSGVVNRVCFPTGTALFGDTLYIYYGAADKCVACVSVSLTELLDELLKQIK